MRLSDSQSMGASFVELHVSRLKQQSSTCTIGKSHTTFLIRFSSISVDWIRNNSRKTMFLTRCFSCDSQLIWLSSEVVIKRLIYPMTKEQSRLHSMIRSCGALKYKVSLKSWTKRKLTRGNTLLSLRRRRSITDVDTVKEVQFPASDTAVKKYGRKEVFSVSVTTI